MTDRDIVTRCVALGGDPAETPVKEIMSRGVVTCAPFDELDAAVKRMEDEQVRRLPVLDGGRLVGIVTLCDMARDSNCDMEAAAARDAVFTLLYTGLTESDWTPATSVRRLHEHILSLQREGFTLVSPADIPSIIGLGPTHSPDARSHPRGVH